MPLDKILEAIEKEGASEAERILAAAQQEADRIISEAKKMAAEEKEQFIQESKAKNEMEWSHRISRAKLESRKQILNAQKEMLDQVFNKTLNHLRELEPGVYQDWIIQRVGSTCSSVQEKLIISASDRTRLSENLKNDLQKTLKESGITEEMEIEYSRNELDSGFILRHPEYEVIMTFDEILRSLRSEMESELTRLLFDVK